MVASTACQPSPADADGPSPADAAVVWLHGDGETGAAWQHLEETLALRLPWTQWAFPDAREDAPTTGKRRGRRWFRLDFPLMDSAAEPAPAGGLDAAVAAVHAMLNSVEAGGIKPSRIVLGGFGHGAALALLAGRTFPRKLGGIAVISGWYLRPRQPSSTAPGGRPPVLLCHGEEDDDVPFELYEEACQWLRRDKFEVRSFGYEKFGHRECATELTVLAAPKNFITACLPTLHAKPASAAARRKPPEGNPCEEAPVPHCKLDESVDFAAFQEQERDLLEAASRLERMVASTEHAWQRAEQHPKAPPPAPPPPPPPAKRAPAPTAGGGTGDAVGGRLLSVTEVADGAGDGDGRVRSLQVVLALTGVSSIKEVELSVGAKLLELQLVGVAPLRVPLPKPVDLAETAMVAKFSRKSGQLKVTLRLE